MALEFLEKLGIKIVFPEKKVNAKSQRVDPATGIRPYQPPTDGQALSWWERRAQEKALREAAANSLKPKIVHTPPRGPQPR
jgi:hypothetical protein